MLPKLAHLHNRRQVLFFWATNYLKGFDPAIRRSGRFDLLIRMGPPSVESKTSENALMLYVKPRDDADRATYPQAAKLMRQLVERLDPTDKETLTWFTFGDMQSFLRQLCKQAPILKCLQETSDGNFGRMVKSLGAVMALADPKVQEQYKNESGDSRVQK